MGRATVHDLARAAGVSLAAVDRAVDRLGGVGVATLVSDAPSSGRPYVGVDDSAAASLMGRFPRGARRQPAVRRRTEAYSHRHPFARQRALTGQSLESGKPVDKADHRAPPR